MAVIVNGVQQPVRSGWWMWRSLYAIGLCWWADFLIESEANSCTVWFENYSCLGLHFAASWAISVYYAFQRTWKPFNPILGETYEMVNHNGITFLSEQVRQSVFKLPYNRIHDCSLFWSRALTWTWTNFSLSTLVWQFYYVSSFLAFNFIVLMVCIFCIF